MERIDEITGPPVVGKFYLVPTIHYVYCEMTDYWPVIGPKHNDIEYFNFYPLHYHVDGRFLSKRVSRRLSRYVYPRFSVSDGPWPCVNSRPLSQRDHIRGNNHSLPHPVWRRRKCLFSVAKYVYGEVAAVKELNDAMAGCRPILAKNGRYLCPHRKSDITTIPAGPDGVLVCPLHGLKIDATGTPMADFPDQNALL